MAAAPDERNEHVTLAAATGTGFSPGDIPRAPHRDPRWRQRYARRLWLSDLLTLVWVVYGTQILWFGFSDSDVAGLDLSYWLFSAGLVLAWMVALALADTRSDRVLGVGSTEYVRTADASLRLFGVIAILAFLFRVDVARGFLLISLPLGIFMLVLVRWLWRRWLAVKRSVGEYSARVLLVGSRESVQQIGSELQRSPAAGYRVVGACIPRGPTHGVLERTNIPIVGDVERVDRAIEATEADTVAVTSTDALPPDKVKQISWALEAKQQQLVLAPSLLDVAGPRIHTRPVSGLPLIHVETPRFSAGQRFVKRAFDLFVSAALVVILSPVIIAVALTIRLSEPAPVLFRHERIGRDGEPFWMLKFRSMRPGADAELPALLRDQGKEATPLFKVDEDPRVTPVGRFLRKYSLDELPQLFNVLSGSMSLVGPRPQIAAEVALYTDAARRRLRARPGITGLWQVSGRSTLDWERAIRLDLYYVENWSLLGDVAILLKTLRVVATPGESAR